MLKPRLQYFGHLMQRVDSLEKTLDAGRNWGQEEKGTTEDRMAGWHHQLNGYAFEQAQGYSTGKGSLACYVHRVTGIGHNLSAEQQQQYLHWRMLNLEIYSQSKTLC